MERLTLWTDGGAWLRGLRPGGWAFLAEERNRIVYRDSGAEVGATSNRMELRAVVEALRWAFDEHPDVPLLVATDCRNIVQRRRSSLRADPRLWQDLDALVELRAGSVAFAWVRGHAGEHLNERADKMATAARNRLLRQLREGREVGAYL